jgi:hypothetical protein
MTRILPDSHRFELQAHRRADPGKIEAMRCYLGTIGIVLFLSTGIAAAGPHGGGGAVRDHRSGGGGGGVVVRDHRGPAGGGVVVRDHRGPVHVSGGRYVFPGGVVRTYRAPVIRAHYHSYYRRPALIVESYDPVPGYVWMRGNWRWNGVEWLWVPGYWVVATAPVSASIRVGGSVVVD